MFSVVNFQVVEGPEGPPGEDGVDGTDGLNGTDGVDGISNIYYCSSQSEIEDALDTIGTTFGTIIITENITLSSTINIDGGGHCIIQGAGPITLDRNADDETFNISNVKSLTIKDLIIDASDITSTSISGIYVSEGNDNPVNIQNLQINASDVGRGVDINSENVWLQNCYISGFQTGIYLGSNSGYCHILDNSLFDIVFSSGDACGIHLDTSDYNTLTGNMIDNVDGNNAFGIHLENSDYNTFTGNTITNIDGYVGAIGIFLVFTDSNTFTGNIINNIIANTSSAVGFNVVGSTTFSTFIGNRIDTVSSISSLPIGFNVGAYSDYNSIIGNVINNLFLSVLGPAIYLRIDADLNTVVGNTCSATGGITDFGSNNEVGFNAVFS